MYFVIGLLLSVIMIVSNLIIVQNGCTRGTEPLIEMKMGQILSDLWYLVSNI